MAGIKTALVGLGYWGPNLLRTLNKLDAVAAAFDKDDNRVRMFATDPMYHDVHFGVDYEVCLGRHDVRGVVIATPPHTHHQIAMECIDSGKHLFIEKPMTLNVKEAEEIVEAANKKNLVVLVGHIFLYSPEVIMLKEIINSEDFGDILYIYTQRLNLGKIQSPANVVEDLAPHDISVLDYLLEDTCKRVSVQATKHVLKDSEDVAFINMEYHNEVTAHLHLSWLDPLKIRNTVVVGSKQMVVCDSATKAIHIYNKRVDVDKRALESNQSYAAHLMSYKYGDVISPFVNGTEPMLTECQDFLNCIETGEKPVANGELGLEVVRTLEAMQKSLKDNDIWTEVIR